MDYAKIRDRAEEYLTPRRGEGDVRMEAAAGHSRGAPAATRGWERQGWREMGGPAAPWFQPAGPEFGHRASRTVRSHFCCFQRRSSQWSFTAATGN